MDAGPGFFRRARRGPPVEDAQSRAPFRGEPEAHQMCEKPLLMRALGQSALADRAVRADVRAQ